MPPRSSALGLVLFAIAAILAGCAGNNGGTMPAPDPTLAGRAFLSVRVTDGGSDHPLVPGTRIQISFRPADFGASAGCNTLGGRYHLDSGRLIVEGMSTTDMGCDAARGAQDNWLAMILGMQPAISLNGSDLALQAGSVEIRLQDREVADPDRPLAGTNWAVESIISGDTVASLPAGAAASIKFAADGTFTVFTGCNQGGGSWALTGDAVQLSNLVTTKMACLGPGAQLEAAVLGVLQHGQLSVTITADSLTLQAGSAGLQLRAR